MSRTTLAIVTRRADGRCMPRNLLVAVALVLTVTACGDDGSSTDPCEIGWQSVGKNTDYTHQQWLDDCHAENEAAG